MMATIEQIQDFTRRLVAEFSPQRVILYGLCFHAQQCAEKYIKARLVEAGIDFP